eukprot:SAG11_NODE_38716_length_251_cov_0.677632_1_plen_57_part_10
MVTQTTTSSAVVRRLRHINDLLCTTTVRSLGPRTTGGAGATPRQVPPTHAWSALDVP